MDQYNFSRDFVVDLIAASARPFVWLKYGGLVTCWNFHCLVNCVYASEINWEPLSVRHIAGDRWPARTRFVASIAQELCNSGKRSNSKKSLLCLRMSCEMYCHGKSGTGWLNRGSLWYWNALPWSSASVLEHRWLPPVFESRCGHILRLFHLWLRFITFEGGSATNHHHHLLVLNRILCTPIQFRN